MRQTRKRVASVNFTLVLAMLVGCGARSGLGEVLPDGGVDAPVVIDSSAPIDPDPRAVGTWHYATIRAICDLFVLRFCDANHAVVSVQYDGCSVPDEPSSVSYDVHWDTSTRFRLSIRGGSAPPPGINANLTFEYNSREDSLTWVDPPRPFQSSFPVESGRGPGNPPIESFIMCP